MRVVPLLPLIQDRSATPTKHGACLIGDELMLTKFC